ncbi:MAG: hypothetical protein KDA28_11995 [Phycisphaerales bacterium]|nr:hypothetical protein [Phycisphaerales bacterium]
MRQAIMAGLVTLGMTGVTSAGPTFVVVSSSRSLAAFADSVWCEPPGTRLEFVTEAAGPLDEVLESVEGCAIATTIAQAHQQSMVPVGAGSMVWCGGGTSTFCDAFLFTEMEADASSIYDVTMRIDARVRYEARGFLEAGASGDLPRVFTEAQVLVQHPAMAVPHVFALARPGEDGATSRVTFEASGVLDPGPVQVLVHAISDVDRPADPIHGETSSSYFVTFEIFCLADFAAPFGTLDIFDVLTFLEAFADGAPMADLVEDGVFDVFDVLAYLEAFEAGCS